MNEQFPELSQDLANKIIPPTGCWRDFNTYHRRWEILQRYGQIRNFIFNPEDLPPEPDPADFSDLSSDCSES